jgi:hypothetical protein
MMRSTKFAGLFVAAARDRFDSVARQSAATVATLLFVCLACAVVGCGEKQQTALTVGQATDLALKLANEESEVLYKCRPFTNGPPAQLIEGRWVWQARQAKGQGDIEGSVKFGSNGANPNVRVLLLDGRPTSFLFLNPR